jgi:hypothetical protein
MADKTLGAYNIADLRKMALREEVDRVMALIGCSNIADLGPAYLHIPDPSFFAASRGRPHPVVDFPKSVVHS